MSAPQLFDRKLLLQRRQRAARQGAMPDFLLRRAAGDMAERLEAVQRDFTHVLALGAHAKGLADVLSVSCRNAELFVAMDGSAPSADGSALQVRGDEELVPFRDGAFDLIVSALSLQFVNDLPGTLIQIRRALKPDGLFLASVLGGATLAELREAFTEAETELEGGVSPRVAPMADIRDYGGLLQRAGLALPVADSDLVTVTYASPLALMHDLRAMGATNVLTERRRTPLRRRTLLHAMEIYFERFAEPGGRIRATFEIIHLLGWAPHDSQQKPLKPGSAAARLADALGVPEHQLKRS
ncbi:MAG: methyltransferase domain-containing protein [Rhodomicrobiaceae bacterium]